VSAMDILGKPAVEHVRGPAVYYIADRWPFGAHVHMMEGGLVYGQLLHAGSIVYSVGPVRETRESVAAKLDAAAKEVFKEADWYRQP